MKGTEGGRIKIFTWHVHGSYLYYLSQGPFDIYIPKKSGDDVGYIGRGTTFPFGDNVTEVPIDNVKTLDFDCILYQLPRNYLKDQFEILSEEQRQLPRLYLEHDPPLKIPTDTRHVVDDPNVTIVHVTHYNRLMWDNGDSPTEVVDHGILSQEVSYKGDIPKGIVVINNLDERGRRLGLDVFEQVRKHVPLDLIGMGSEKLNGLGEILHPRIPEFISHYRFFFNPIRYTSLGLAVLEAMTVGLPVVGLATTEMVTVIKNGKSGILHTNVDYLIEKMKLLIEDHSLAARIGAEGKAYVENRFNIQRFCSDWQRVLTAAMHRVSGNRSKQRAEKEREVPV